MPIRRKFSSELFFVLSVVALVLAPGVRLTAHAAAQNQAEVRVAAAADLQFAMQDLASEFQKQTGAKISVTYGSSGNFFSQLQNNAPFDLFFSADIDYPQRLESAGLTEPGTIWEYAQGAIVIWMPATADASSNLAQEGWNALLAPAVTKIAIANPEHAPYGRAAVAALKAANLYDRVQPKLVFGENISQAAQFVQSGNAQAGIIALSLALSPAMQSGQRWEIPRDSYPPIRQAAVVLKSSPNKPQARAFLDFLKSQPGRATLAKYGFTLPASSAPPREPAASKPN